MKFLIFLVVAVLLFQIGVYFLFRHKKKLIKRDNVIEKYNIKSSKDAWALINNTDIPEEDRRKIEEIYERN